MNSIPQETLSYQAEKLGRLAGMLEPNAQTAVLELITDYLTGERISITPEQRAKQEGGATERQSFIADIINWAREIDGERLRRLHNVADELAIEKARNVA